jgi:hypothetical protein
MEKNRFDEAQIRVRAAAERLAGDMMMLFSDHESPPKVEIMVRDWDGDDIASYYAEGDERTIRLNLK